MFSFINVVSILGLVLTIASFVLLFVIGKRDKISFGLQLLIGLGLAFIVGIIIMFVVGIQNGDTMIFGENALAHMPEVFTSDSWLVQFMYFVSTLFTSLMKALIVPLVFFSILHALISKRNQGAGKIIGYAVGGFVVLVAISALIAIGLSLVTNLGKGIDLSVLESALSESERLQNVNGIATDYTFFSLLASFLPTNIISDMAANKMIPIIIFVFLLGFGLNKARATYTKGVETLSDVVEAIFGALTTIIDEVLGILPYSIFAMVLKIMLSSNFSSLFALVKYAAVIIVAMLIVFVLQLLVISLSGKSPVEYLKNVGPALLVALTTASSNATLPVSIRSLKEEMHVDDKVANIVPSFGTMMGMAGCGAIFPAVLTILTLNAMGTPITLFLVIQIVAIICLASFGMQGVPGTATYAATLVLTTLGLPLTSILLVGPIDFFVDMLRTTLNVNGSLMVATLVDKAVKE